MLFTTALLKIKKEQVTAKVLQPRKLVVTIAKYRRKRKTHENNNNQELLKFHSRQRETLAADL